MSNSLTKYSSFSANNKYTSTSNIFDKNYIGLVAVTAALSISPFASAVKGFQNEQIIKTTESFSESPLLKSIALQIKICVDKSNQFNIEPPSELVKKYASNFLLKLSTNYSINAHFVNPSHNGGIIIEFNKENIFSIVQIFNDEDVVVLIRSNNKRKAWDLNLNNFEQLVFSELFA